jgi:2-polyprenyl-6-methoxyphenol hydroxylase-like FAD-dependent oxidoreductase
MAYRIAIIGAGTAGLAASCFLKRDGHEVVIYERFPTARPVGAGLLLQPTGLAVLATLGLDKLAIARAAPVTKLHGVGKGGRVVFDISYTRLAPHLHGLGIHRGVLFGVLHDAVVAAGVPVETATAIAAVDYRNGQPVLVDERGGIHGPFDLVVDGGGARSALRVSHAVMKVERPYPFGAVWGICRDNEGLFAQDTLAQRYDAARRMAGILPVGTVDGARCVALFWSLPVARYADWRDKGMAAWRGELAALWPETESLTAQFDKPDDLAVARYSDIVLRSPYARRLAFIGDAAHSASPQLGQGANLALADAWTLADSLRRTPSVDEALPDYACRRRDPVHFYQTASRWLTPFFQSESRLYPWMRDIAFGPMAKVPYLHRQMLHTLAGVKTGLFTSLDPGDWCEDYALVR